MEKNIIDLLNKGLSSELFEQYGVITYKKEDLFNQILTNEQVINIDKIDLDTFVATINMAVASTIDIPVPQKYMVLYGMILSYSVGIEHEGVQAMMNYFGMMEFILFNKKFFKDNELVQLYIELYNEAFKTENSIYNKMEKYLEKIMVDVNNTLNNFDAKDLESFIEKAALKLEEFSQHNKPE